MDSLTQFVLGAAVGEATLGKKEGNKAMLWGGIAGTIPDLDILIYPFVPEVQELAIHRGLSHSFVFALLAPIPFGVILSRIYKRSSSWAKWTNLFLWAFLTHILVDALTNYGTQLFYPFSDHPVSFDSIFIIDLLYTLPLIIGLVVALVAGKKNKFQRTRANQIGLFVSSLYLVFTLVNKSFVTQVFEDTLQSQNISYEQLFTNPSPLNNILWYGVADDGTDLWIGSYSWFDEDKNISFERVPKNKELLAPYHGQLPVERLFWFSKGYFAVEEVDGALYVNDVRFPRTDLYLDEDGGYVFSFRLVPDPADSTQFIDFRQGDRELSFPPGILDRFVERVLGNKTP
ncbi:MAG: metal-dependent hydrolase [Rhodothermales bacterium]